MDGAVVTVVGAYAIWASLTFHSVGYEQTSVLSRSAIIFHKKSSMI